jgi:hypothetical protein
MKVFEKKETLHYFDAKTYNQSNMTNLKQELQSVPNGIKYGVIGIVILVAIIATFALSGESEADKVARIAKLDYQRQEQLKENEATRQATIDCDLYIQQEMGKDNEILPCEARSITGSTIIPEAKAKELDTGDWGISTKDADVDCLKSFTTEQNQYLCFQSGATFVRNLDVGSANSFEKPSQKFLEWKKNRTNS